MKITAIDRKALQYLRGVIDSALDELSNEQGWGIKLQLGNGSYSGSNGHFKLNISAIDESGTVVTEEAEDFKSQRGHGAAGKPVGLADIPPAERTSLYAMDKAFRHASLLKSSSQQILLVALARFTSDRGTAYPSQERLAETLGRSNSWVSKQIGRLGHLGCIKVIKKPTRGRNTEYLLILDDDTHHR